MIGHVPNHKQSISFVFLEIKISFQKTFQENIRSYFIFVFYTWISSKYY